MAVGRARQGSAVRPEPMFRALTVNCGDLRRKARQDHCAPRPKLVSYGGLWRLVLVGSFPLDLPSRRATPRQTASPFSFRVLSRLVLLSLGRSDGDDRARKSREACRAADRPRSAALRGSRRRSPAFRNTGAADRPKSNPFGHSVSFGGASSAESARRGRVANFPANEPLRSNP